MKTLLLHLNFESFTAVLTSFLLCCFSFGIPTFTAPSGSIFQSPDQKISVQDSSADIASAEGQSSDDSSEDSNDLVQVYDDEVESHSLHFPPLFICGTLLPEPLLPFPDLTLVADHPPARA